MKEFLKTPAGVLDYTFRWSDWLNDGEIITDSVISSSPIGLTLGTKTVYDTEVVQWISGGTLDASYEVLCMITTNQNREDTRGAIFTIKNR